MALPELRQAVSPSSINAESALHGSRTVPTPTAAPPAAPGAADTQRIPMLSQDSRKTPPRRRESQLSCTSKDRASNQDLINESAAKDDKRLIRRLSNLIQELDYTVQPAEQAFDLAHNAHSGMIRMPGDSDDQDIHRDISELLDKSNSAELRLSPEVRVKMNGILRVSGVVTECRTLT